MVSEQATSIPRDVEAHLFARPAKDHGFQQPRRHDPQSARLARPLGIRPEVPLTDAQRSALQRLQDYDLSPVRARLMKQGALPVESLDDTIFEFRRFLGLVVLGHEELPMVSPTIDEVWHTCLLFSRLYADLCEQTVGKFVHHEPFSGAPKDARAKLDERRKLEEAYTRAYGEMPLWLQPGRQQEANGQAGELTDADLEGVAGGGSKPGGEACDCSCRPKRPL
jgi:hypothetical protein